MKSYVVKLSLDFYHFLFPRGALRLVFGVSRGSVPWEWEDVVRGKLAFLDSVWTNFGQILVG